MDHFRPATRAFAAPTEVQRQGWERIAAGEHTLLIAPTGSGKTLAAFLYALDHLSAPRSALGDDNEPGVRVVYVSPLKALVYDIERNLRVPLAGMQRMAAALGEPLLVPRVDVRTGDTSAHDRRRQIRAPGEILVTTPESLFLLLGSQARETLLTTRWVIVDEIHAMAATKHGAHLALSFERLAHLATGDPQRIGLSATARPAEEVARFLGGDRPVSIVDAHLPPALDLGVVVPVADMTRPVIETAEGDIEVVGDGQKPPGTLMLADEEEATRQYGIWPAVYPKILDLVHAHRSTIVFVNSRGLCERLAHKLNEQAGEELVRAHHGSLAHEQRRQIEEGLKSGALRGIVATSSLELGIDMGAVDLVVLVESPGSMASRLQRVGRAGHRVGEVSIGRIFPKHRGDLLEATVVARRMAEGAIETLAVPRNPLDVLAQQVVAMASVRPWPVSELARVLRRAANFRDLPDAALRGVLDMLSGLYPSHEFAELRPRINWDRERDLIEGRRGARMLAAVNAGTIPDRGLFGVYLGDDGPRVGELDEEMVHESLPGQTFTLGASTWRIREITRDRGARPGGGGQAPLLARGGSGAAAGAGARFGGVRARDRAAPRHRSAAAAARRVRGGRARRSEPARLSGGAAGGDWRVCILTPFGARVHAPWALALRAAVSDRVGYDVQAVWSDDGIVLTLADGDEPPDASALTPAADEIEERLVEELPRSPLFATEFRENAARALLLPRRRPGQRTPLFAQRLRAEKRRARHPDELHDLLRQLGDLTVDQIRERSEADPEPWMRELEQGRRSVQVRVAGREAWIAVEDAELYRDALGVAPPAGVAEAFLALVERPLEALLERWARTHRPFGTDRVAERFGLVPEHARLFLLGLARAGKLLQGEFRPDAEGEEWCDPDVLRQIKRRTIAKLRGQVAPVSREVLGRFLPSWHRVAGAPPHDRLEDAIVQLEGMPLSYRELVRMILPARVRRFHAEQLDELGALGWLVWVGHSALRGDDGRIVLYRRRRVDRLLLPAIEEEAGFALDERHRSCSSRGCRSATASWCA